VTIPNGGAGSTAATCASPVAVFAFLTCPFASTEPSSAIETVNGSMLPAVRPNV
jgi:hypothetical protein